MRVSSILAGILCVLGIQIQAAESTRIVTLRTNGIKHEISIPQSWIQSQGKTEWRNGPGGEELISLYAVAPKGTPESTVAESKATFIGMFSKRKIPTSVLEESGSDGRWIYAIVASPQNPKPGRSLRVQEYRVVHGKLFYLQYSRQLKPEEKEERALAEGKRLLALWKTE